MSRISQGQEEVLKRISSRAAELANREVNRRKKVGPIFYGTYSKSAYRKPQFGLERYAISQHLQIRANMEKIMNEALDQALEENIGDLIIEQFKAEMNAS